MIEELLKTFGFPIAIAIYFIYQNGKVEKAHKDDLKGIAVQTIGTLDKNTEALDKNTEMLQQTNMRLRDAERGV